MITEEKYNAYLEALLAGHTDDCEAMVTTFLKEHIELKQLYLDLFQRSLYEVGELWEKDRISVAREHLATATTEHLMSLAYPALFAQSQAVSNCTALVTSAPNEFHQIGGKMVADMMELYGWDTHFLGANVPTSHLLEHIDQEAFDVVAISLSVYFNMPRLIQTIEAIRSHFPHLDIVVGGQAFRFGGSEHIHKLGSIEYLPSIEALETSFKKKVRPCDR